MTKGQDKLFPRGCIHMSTLTRENEESINKVLLTRKW